MEIGHKLEILAADHVPLTLGLDREELRKRFHRTIRWGYPPSTKRSPYPITHGMRKTFPLEVPNHKPPRVVEAIKAEIRKYLKRERRKPLPEGVDFWDFDCCAGKDAESAKAVHVSGITKSIDTASQENWPAIHIKILAKHGHRTKAAMPEQTQS